MVKFTDEQLKIIESTCDRLVVNAGPGSGKTEILAERIANNYQKNDKPFIALVFNNAAAQELKERVFSKIDKTINPNIFIGTFSSFFLNIFNDFRWRIHKLCLNSMYKEKLTPHSCTFKFDKNNHSLKLVESQDMWCDSFAEINKEKLTKWENDFYIDGIYVDGAIPKFIFKTKIMKTDFFKNIFQIYDCIYIDEYQDLSFSDIWWLESLHEVISKSFLVGDIDQMIFGWKGSSKKVIKKIMEMGYVEMKILKNHRSTEELQILFSKYKKMNKIDIPLTPLTPKKLQAYISDNVDTLILLNSNKNIEKALNTYKDATFKIDIFKENIYFTIEEFKIIEPFFLWKWSRENGLYYSTKVEVINKYPNLANCKKNIINRLFSLSLDWSKWIESISLFLHIKIKNYNEAIKKLKEFYPLELLKKIIPQNNITTRFMTSASAKGLQAERVIWAPLDWTINNKNNISSNYVSLTRAKTHLIISPINNDKNWMFDE